MSEVCGLDNLEEWEGVAQLQEDGREDQGGLQESVDLWGWRAWPD